MHSRINKIVLLFLLIIFSSQIPAQDASYVKENYVKHEYRVTMRDGVKLFTSVYIPKDSSQTYPILMTRTPYSAAPYGEDKYRRIPKHLAEEKFIFVIQDVRGKFMSEGEFVNMRPYIPDKNDEQVDEASDSYDTIEWLINNIPHNNGNVGIFGISYPGFYSAMSLNDSHPNLKAVSPQAPIADWFVRDDMHHNGAFTLSLSYVFFSVFGQARPELTTHWTPPKVKLNGDSYNYFLNIGPIKNVNENYFKNEISFWNDITEHGTYDEFWQSRNTLNYFDNVTPAVMTVGGWYDSEDLYGSLNTYQTIEKKNENTYNILIMGPWPHGGWARSNGDSFGDLLFGFNTSEFYRDSIELPFFKYYLKEEGELNLPEAYVFETGKNIWHKFNQWPPADETELQVFLADDHKLSIGEPEKNSTADYDEYISDPDHPVPYTAKFHSTKAMYNRTYMVEDQRFASSRPDVLTFESGDLYGDITVAGPIDVELYVSTSGTDADWIVKLIDVYPDTAKNPNPNPNKVEMGGYQMLIRGEIMRGKFRNSLEHPEPFVPNKVTKVKIEMNDIYHTFLKGHKLMVQIQSSWFPIFDRNPQKFCNIYKASEDAFQKATQRVYHTDEYRSKIILKTVKTKR